MRPSTLNQGRLLCTHDRSNTLPWVGGEVPYFYNLMAQLVKNPPVMWETWVQSLGWEDPLEKGKTTHSSILAWRIPWGRKELDTTERLSLHFKHCVYLRIS